jgi:hypothetical protein
LGKAWGSFTTAIWHSQEVELVNDFERDTEGETEGLRLVDSETVELSLAEGD